jgi:hypothetical protein
MKSKGHKKKQIARELRPGARVEFAFTLKSRFCHRELLWF